MRPRLFGRWAALLVILLAGGMSLAAPAPLSPRPLVQTSTKRYVATLMPLNAQAAGTALRGELRLTVSGDTLTINLQAQGLPPSTMHMAHLHGFEDGAAAHCAPTSADTNHDGVVDLHETEPASGVTLVPLNGDPAALDIPGKGYPSASSSGRIFYKKSVSVAKLNQAMAKAYHGASLDLTRRVVYIHGVRADTHLPPTAASLPGVPAQATLPIACGLIILLQ